MHPPHAFYPLRPNRVWRTYTGGRVLDELAGAPEPADGHFPEDWIASTTRARNVGREDHPDEGLSFVEHHGRRVALIDLIEAQPVAMLGERHLATHGKRVGFLAKLLDASIRLHLQAHPTVEFSRRHLNANHGKTEGYYILGTRPEVAEPFIYLGFQRPPGRDAYRRAILEQDGKALLAPFTPVPVKPGDTFVVPGSVPHAIGAGVFMIEMMEPSDFVVRFEFERGGYVLPEAARFMGRDVDFALDMLDFSAWPLERIRRERFGVPTLVERYGDAGVKENLIDARLSAYFRVDRLTLDGRVTHVAGSLHVGVVARGDVTLSGPSAPPHRFTRGQSFLVPAATTELIYESAGAAEVVLISPGEA